MRRAVVTLVLLTGCVPDPTVTGLDLSVPDLGSAEDMSATVDLSRTYDLTWPPPDLTGMCPVILADLQPPSDLGPGMYWHDKPPWEYVPCVVPCGDEVCTPDQACVDESCLCMYEFSSPDADGGCPPDHFPKANVGGTAFCYPNYCMKGRHCEPLGYPCANSSPKQCACPHEWFTCSPTLVVPGCE
jgi:hypothetical protein